MELPAFAKRPDPEPDVARRVPCSWCSEGMYVHVNETSKFCANCRHQGAKPQTKCECEECIRVRLGKRGLPVPPAFVPPVDERHCSTCTCNKKKKGRAR